MIPNQRFMTLNEINFDELYAGSLPKLEDGTFQWPPGVTTPEQRKAYVHDRMAETLGLPNGYGFWTVAPNRIALTGTVNSNVLTFAIGLLAPDENGSLAYSMTPEIIDTYRAHMAAAGFTSACAFLTEGSSLIETSKTMWGVGDEAMMPTNEVGHVLMRLWTKGS